MSKSSLLAWWQLLRAGNVFTAASNVIAGFVLAQATWQPLGPLLLLIGASALLYEAGMVLNDVFDAKLDARERPERPIPSGRIGSSTAILVGWGILLTGLLAAGSASYLVGHYRPLLVATMLALCIIAYDGYFKSTPLGPWVMGSCRLLNVMLGGSLVAESWTGLTIWYALAVGVYTVGLTYFARQENEAGWKLSNTLGTSFVVVATLCICLWSGKLLGSYPFTLISFAVLNFFLWISPGWFSPTAFQVGMLRSTVGRLIMGFILLDALAVYTAWDLKSGFVVLALLLPTWIASRFAPMT